MGKDYLISKDNGQFNLKRNSCNIIEAFRDFFERKDEFGSGFKTRANIYQDYINNDTRFPTLQTDNIRVNPNTHSGINCSPVPA